MSDLTFWTNPMSRGSIARWMLEEVGAPYETVVLAYGPQMQSPDYLAINPMGKVPAIRHGTQVVTETAAICAYLAEAFPEAGLGPRPEERGAYYRWLFFAAGPVEAAVTAKALNLLPPAEKRGFVGYGSYETVVETLAAHLGARSFVAGERFTAADVYVGSQVSAGLMFKTLPERPEFRAYLDRMKHRPAAVRAREKDAALREVRT